jgi:polyhydroxyalkanoate depolymerase
VITTVPENYPGAGRQVYPGFVQLTSFMSMNLGSHMMSHYKLFQHMVQGDGESADATKRFYDEYRSVCDLPAEFYLQTVDVVFQQHALPRANSSIAGRRSTWARSPTPRSCASRARRTTFRASARPAPRSR